MKLFVGKYYIEFSSRRVVLGPVERRFRGRHFTLFFEPRGGKWKPHITCPWSEKRIWLPAIDVRRLESFFKEFERELGKRWLAALVQSSPEQLATDGWLLVVPDDDALRVELERLAGVGTCRLDRDLWRRLNSAAIQSFDSPRRLTEFVGLRRPLLLVREPTDGSAVERCWASYYAFELPEERPPGWYVSPYDWIDEEVFKIFVSRAQSRLEGALLQLCRYLGLGNEDDIRNAFRVRSGNAVPQ